jgi:hypothetical protein
MFMSVKKLLHEIYGSLHANGDGGTSDVFIGSKSFVVSRLARRTGLSEAYVENRINAFVRTGFLREPAEDSNNPSSIPLLTNPLSALIAASDKGWETFYRHNPTYQRPAPRMTLPSPFHDQIGYVSVALAR